MLSKFIQILPLTFTLALSGCNDSGGSDDFIKVYKDSGAVQCEPDSGTSVESMQQELVQAGIDVQCAESGSDGHAYATVCGGKAGDINIYTIPTANLPDAEKLGFASVIDVPNYTGSSCPETLPVIP